MKVDFENKDAFLNSIVDDEDSDNVNDYLWYNKKDDRVYQVSGIRRQKVGKGHLDINKLQRLGYVKLPHIKSGIILDFYVNYIFSGFDEIEWRIKFMPEDDAFMSIFYLGLAEQLIRRFSFQPFFYSKQLQ